MTLDMVFNELLEKLDPNDNTFYYSIEIFLINLLKIQAEKEGKTLVSENRNMIYDAYAPEGISDIKGPTYIDIKLYMERIPINDLRRVLSKSPESKADEHKNILFIIPTINSTKLKNNISRYFGNSYPNKQIIFWGSEEVNHIISSNREEANDIANNLFSLRIKSVVKESDKDWVEARSEKIQLLKSLYQKGQFSFFLGAGVSSSAGMPDWNTLINSLFVTYLTNEFNGKEEIKINENEIKEIVNRLNEVDQQSALMSARYLRKALSKNTLESKGFIDEITKNLYSLRNQNKKIDSELIKAIVKMCIPRRTGAKIKSVVTYNFDDLIEKQLKKQSIHFQSIYSDNDIIDPDEIPIYHVHGFLPEETNEYQYLDKSTLVFSEEGYHHIYSNSYHWSNLVQLSQLRENHCLMVGLSMSDPNLRRLLDISFRNSERPRHFAFMKRLSSKKFITEGTEQKIKNKSNAEKFLNRHHSLNEDIMRELGVSIIWYTEHDEISNLLNDIMK